MRNYTNYIVRGPKEELDKLVAKIQSKTTRREDRSMLLTYCQDAIHYAVDDETKQVTGWCWCSLNACPIENMYVLPAAMPFLDLTLEGAHKDYKAPAPAPCPKRVVIKENPDKGEMSFNGLDWLLTKAERDQARYIAAERAIMDYLTFPLWKKIIHGPKFFLDFLDSRQE
jgi:hypothetical protein